MINTFYNYAKEKNCVSTTIITSPFESDLEFYGQNTSFTYRDIRIGQFTKLPESTAFIEESLFKIFDSRKRRNIRKAKKNDVCIDFKNGERYIEFFKVNTSRKIWLKLME